MTPTCVGQDAPPEQRPQREIAWPFISVVVPVRNEERFVKSTLEQLLTQDYETDRFEVLVADGQSTDETRPVVRALQVRHTNLHLLANPGLLSSSGRNVAIRAAHGSLIVIVDGHCDLESCTYLRDVAEAFADSGADCIGRPQPLDVAAATPLQRAIAAGRASRLGHNPSSHIYEDTARFVRPQSVAVAYRREVFSAVGLFDEAFDACEDVEFNHRVEQAGLRCFFTPKVRVRYYPRETLTGLFRQMQRYGRGRVRLLRKHPETFSLACFVPAAFLVGLAVGPVLAAYSSWLGAAYAGVVGLYALAVLLTGVYLALRAGDGRLLPWLPLVFAAIHGGAGVGILQEVVAGRKRRRPLPAGPTLAFPGVPNDSKPEAGRLIGDDRSVLNALTIDVEDYYHVSAFEKIVKRRDWDRLESRVVASTQRILGALDAAAVRGTFFVLGWVAERHPDLVRAIHVAGHEVGCHGYWHRLIYEQTPQEFRDDLSQARDVLQDLIGERVVAYRAPSFSITRRSLWALDVLIEEGFQIDSSIYPTYHDRYGVAGTPLEPHRITRAAGEIWEFPPAVYRRLGYPLPIGGGGYFRLYPYAFTRRGLRALNAQERPFVTYLHPWEFDPTQPRLRPGRLKAFRHYVNLHRTERRLACLLRDFRLGTISEALSRCQDRGHGTIVELKRAA
jgi:polysaccharide deacetylase family protein (PEP-CTERM system associated)